MTHPRWCATCRRHTPTDVIPAASDPYKQQHIPARLFCSICGFFHGCDETPAAVLDETETVRFNGWHAQMRLAR